MIYAFYDAFYQTYHESLSHCPQSLTHYLGNLWEDAMSMQRGARHSEGIASCKRIAEPALHIAKDHTLLEKMAAKDTYDTGLAAMLLADIQYNLYILRSRKG